MSPVHPPSCPPASGLSRASCPPASWSVPGGKLPPAPGKGVAALRLWWSAGGEVSRPLLCAFCPPGPLTRPRPVIQLIPAMGVSDSARRACAGRGRPPMSRRTTRNISPAAAQPGIPMGARAGRDTGVPGGVTHCAGRDTGVPGSTVSQWRFAPAAPVGTGKTRTARARAVRFGPGPLGSRRLASELTRIAR